jgi:hypothetical protein
MKKIAIFAVLTLTGCAQSTGVMKMGPDTFSVTADALGASNAKQIALTEASGQCQSMGKEILVTNTSSGKDRARSVYEVTFRCLAKGDPELQRPYYESAPDVVVESR